MNPPKLATFITLLACLTPCDADDLQIPTSLPAEEKSNRILNFSIEGFSLSSQMTLSDFRKKHSQSTWNTSQYSERTYCDPVTGECFTKGLTVQILEDEKDFLFLFQDKQPQSKLVGFALDVKTPRSFAEEYKDILLLLGKPNDVPKAQSLPARTTMVFRTWSVIIHGEEVRLNLFWSPRDDVVTWGLSRVPKNSEQDGADQPATAPETKSKSNEKPKPVPEARPQ